MYTDVTLLDFWNKTDVNSPDEHTADGDNDDRPHWEGCGWSEARLGGRLGDIHTHDYVQSQVYGLGRLHSLVLVIGVAHDIQ